MQKRRKGKQLYRFRSRQAIPTLKGPIGARPRSTTVTSTRWPTNLSRFPSTLTVASSYLKSILRASIDLLASKLPSAMEPDPFSVSIVNDVQPTHTYNSNIEQPAANSQSSTFLNLSFSLDNDSIADDVSFNLSYGTDLPGASYATLLDEPFNLFDNPSMPLGFDTMEFQEQIAQDDFQSPDNLLHGNDMAIVSFNNSRVPVPASQPDFTPLNHSTNSDLFATMHELTSNSWPAIGSFNQFSTCELNHQSISTSEESIFANSVPQQFFEIPSTPLKLGLEPFKESLSAHSTGPQQEPYTPRPKPILALDSVANFPSATNATGSVDTQHGPNSDSSINSIQQFSLPRCVKPQQLVDRPSKSSVLKVRKVNIARSKPPTGVPSNSVVIWDATVGSGSKKESWKRRPNPCLFCKLSRKRVSSAVKAFQCAFGD